MSHKLFSAPATLVLLSLLALGQSACTTVPAANPIAVSDPAYLSDQAPPNAHFQDIVDNLSRDFTKHGVRVQAIPMTGALAQTMIKEQAYKEGWSPKETNDQLANLKKITANHLCFNVSLHSETQDATVLKYWGIDLIDQHLKKHDLNFVDKSKKPDAKTTTNVESYTSGGYDIGNFYLPPTTNVYAYDETHYSNTGVICTSANEGIDVSKNFALELKPRFKENLDPIVLVWKHDASKKN